MTAVARIIHGDCLSVLPTLEPESIHAVVCDPPYDLVSIVKRFGKPGSAPCQQGTDGAYAHASRGFMGKAWDGTGIAFRPETWAEVYRVLKPGAHLLAFGGTRTSHRMACAIEDAGFEIRDSIAWMYATGFPKSHSVGKALDRMVGAERETVGPDRRRLIGGAGGTSTNHGRGGIAYGVDAETSPATEAACQWEGWGTALKPAFEPIIVARKPLSESSIAANVLKHGCGALNIDASRVAHSEECRMMAASQANIDNPSEKCRQAGRREAVLELKPEGRWPANAVFSHGDCENGCEPGCPVRELDEQSGILKTNPGVYRRTKDEAHQNRSAYAIDPEQGHVTSLGDEGTASRFFQQFPAFRYEPKPARAERDRGCHALPLREVPHGGHGNCEEDPLTVKMRGSPMRNAHPTVKPLALLRYLVRLVTPPDGTVLDPFCGSGTTGMACLEEGFSFVGIEREAEYVEIARARLTSAVNLFGALE